MNASIYINFATSVFTFVLGLMLLTGVIFPSGRDGTMNMFAIILMIYGIYRFVATISKVKQSKLEQRREKLAAEKEKIFKNL